MLFQMIGLYQYALETEVFVCFGILWATRLLLCGIVSASFIVAEFISLRFLFLLPANH